MKKILHPPQSVEEKIIAEIKRRKRGAVFTPSVFLGFGSRQAVDVCLHRLLKRGVIQRLSRGVYLYPKQHKVLGNLIPSATEIANAISVRDGIRIQPTGAFAANTLGLSEQVPMRVVFLTDGPNRTVKIGKTILQLRQTSPRNMATAGRLSGTIIQAFRAIGKDHLTPEHISRLKKRIPLRARAEILKDIQMAPAWMHRFFLMIADSNDESEIPQTFRQ